MNSAGVRVKIYEDNKCIYEHNDSADSNANNLSALISCLKDIQIKVNDFLTSLVEKRDGSADAENQLTSENDSGSADEIEEVNPKKCKLID